MGGCERWAAYDRAVSDDVAFDEAWKALDPAFAACLDQAWRSLLRRGLPVGAALTQGGALIAQGRNRVYDPPGGDDRLQRTPLAHAEMNALAAAGEADFAHCVLLSTQQPCPMCRAAAEFVEIGETRFLASDPSSLQPRDRYVSSGHSDDRWIVAVNALFLHNVLLVAGPDSPMISRNAAAESETVNLAVELVTSERLMSAPHNSGARESLAAIWEQIAEAAARRQTRLQQ